MILPAVLALIALSTVDPSGDAFGDGSLTPPTAPIYANAAVFDLQSVTLDATPNGTRLGVTLGALGSAVAGGGEPAPVTPPDAPPNDAAAAVVEPPATEQPVTAFMPNIVDVYLGEVPGGLDTTLPGPNLLFPQGNGWLYAVRMTGDGAYYVAHPTPSPEGQGTEEVLAIEDLPRVPLQVLSIEDTLVVYLPFTLPDDIAVQALVGVYDPFSQTGWRPLASSPSPWAFAGDGKQVSPVIDLIAPSADAQRAALQSGVLPSTSHASTVLTVPWLWVMLAGVLVAIFGLVLRGRVRRPVPAGASLPDDATEEGVGEEPAAGTETVKITGQELLAAGEVDDDEDDLIDPRASAADVLAADVAAADVAGGKDQALLVDGRDEFLLDTGEREVAAEDAVTGPTPTEPVAGAEEARGFGTDAEASFLLDLDDPRAVEDFLSEDDEESFWHPRSRKAEAPVQSPEQLVAPQPAQLPAPAPDEHAGPEEDGDAG